MIVNCPVVNYFMSVRVKKVFAVKDVGKSRLPKIIQPNDRPVTPRLDSRGSTPADKRGRARNMQVKASTSQLAQMTLSKFLVLEDIFKNAHEDKEILEAAAKFEELCKEFNETKSLAVSDLSAYQQVYSVVGPFLEMKNNRAMRRFMSGYLHLRAALVDMESKKVKFAQGKPTLAPLAPLGSPTAEKETKSEELEHVNECISRIAYKLSSDASNDSFFANEKIVKLLVAFVGRAHNLRVRTYAAAAMKNASHSPEFRAKVRGFNLAGLFSSFETSNPKELKLLCQVAGIFRGLVIDAESIPILVENHLAGHMFEALKSFKDHADFVFACFRVMTKLSEVDDVRSDVLIRFGAEFIAKLTLEMIKIHVNSPQTVSRIACVLEDFTMQDPSIAASSKDSEFLPALAESLSNENVKQNQQCVVMLTHVIANFAVDEACSQVLMKSTVFGPMFKDCTFKDDDNIGFGLLSIASNFTCYNPEWCPDELIAAIPVAIISKNKDSIIEALRIVLNLSNADNERLVNSDIPTLLVVLMKHCDDDISLVAVQALVNLMRNEPVKQTFKDRKGIASIEAILSTEAISQEMLEAISLLILSYSTWTSDEIARIQPLIEEFEVCPDLIDLTEHLNTLFAKYHAE